MKKKPKGVNRFEKKRRNVLINCAIAVLLITSVLIATLMEDGEKKASPVMRYEIHFKKTVLIGEANAVSIDPSGVNIITIGGSIYSSRNYSVINKNNKRTIIIDMKDEER